jgi:hypothetical protein
VEPKSQTDPKFQGRFNYTRLTAKAVRQALIEEKGWEEEDLPHENTIGVLLNRLGYRLRRVQKRKPIKRLAETDAIFENVHEQNEKSDKRHDSLRISIDTKAKVNVGPFSRRGRSRGKSATQAADHDVEPEHKLVPFGILDVVAGFLTIVFGTSRETSDFIVDCLQQWWDENKQRYAHITQLVINLDNGPELASRRTQFMARMVQFAEQNELEVVLVYYPPYHSKYNPIERCWGILEMHWNGSLLDSTATVCQWARTMTWKGVEATVHVVDKIYNKGVSLTKKAGSWGLLCEGHDPPSTYRPHAPQASLGNPCPGSFELCLPCGLLAEYSMSYLALGELHPCVSTGQPHHQSIEYSP